MDRYHEKGDRIFLVENYVERANSRQLYGDSPLPLGPAMESTIAQVETAVRVAYGGGTFQHADVVLNDRVWYVDPDFLDVFSFQLASGDVSALADPSSIILSNEMATKYFGEDDAMGKDLTLSFAAPNRG